MLINMKARSPPLKFLFSKIMNLKILEESKMIKNMQIIYNKFEKEQEKLRKEYLELGMSEDSIDKLYEFDKKQLARNIAYDRRNQSLELDLVKFSVEIDFSLTDRYFWIEEISDDNIAKQLKKLSPDDLDLLTLLVVEGYTQTEIAHLKGCSKNTISKKFLRIKKYF